MPITTGFGFAARAGEKEFVLERSILKTCDALHNIIGRILMGPPRLLDGLGGDHILQSCFDFFPLVRTLGHQGLVSTVYLQDGLHADSFLRSQTARHAMLYSEEFYDGAADDAWMASRMDLVWGVKCMAHVGSNGIKWGSGRMTTETLMEDLHVGMRSLRQTSNQLRKHVRKFLVTHVTFQQDGALPWSHREKYWEMLRVDVSIMEIMRSVNPRWDPRTQTHSVAATLQDEADPFKKIESLMLYALTFRNFVQTRFGGIGVCARLWLIAESFGLEALFRQTLADPTTSKYYANAYFRICSDAKKWLCVAALAYGPIEQFILDLLEDDRFYRRKEEMCEAIRIESEWVTALPERLLAEILRVVGLEDTCMSASTYKHEVMLSLHISMGYAHIESLRSAQVCHGWLPLQNRLGSDWPGSFGTYCRLASRTASLCGCWSWSATRRAVHRWSRKGTAKVPTQALVIRCTRLSRCARELSPPRVELSRPVAGQTRA